MNGNNAKAEPTTALPCVWSYIKDESGEFYYGPGGDQSYCADEMTAWL
jgi:hypothetical protein